jgi:hypothetical protein
MPLGRPSTGESSTRIERPRTVRQASTGCRSILTPNSCASRLR